MIKKHAKPTTAGNLEAKFDAGEDVLDYFDLNAAKVVPPMKISVRKPRPEDICGQSMIDPPVKRLVRKPVRGVTAISPRSSLALLKRALEIAARIKELESELRSYVNRLPEEAQNRILH